MLLKNVHNKLVSKVNAIDTSGFFLKPNETLKPGLEKRIDDNKIPGTSGLVKRIRL